jgi:2,4-dienoyl-CoA reductase-like NADH-dependent reductase (Old Yellow Enzyme family)
MFEKYKLKDNVILRNKIAVAPMTTWSSNDDLTVSDQEAAYYKLRSKEVGMMITGCTFVNKDYQGFDHEFFGGSDEYIPSLKKLADAIKEGGALAVLQIFHPGRKGIANNGEVISASAVKPTYSSSKREVLTPRAMTEEEIIGFIDDFKQTVRRAIEAGFDGIEIHGANTYLIQQFFSGHTNIREDKWGGSIENRIKLPLAIVNASIEAREEFGTPEFVIGYRFSPEELEENGITLDDTLFLVENLVNTDIDYLHASLSKFNQTSIVDKSDQRYIGKILLDQIAGRKPFIGVGGIHTKQNALDALAFGYDLVALGQAIISDPEWVSKAEKDLEIEQAISKSKYREIEVPDRLMNILKENPDWFKLKD